MAQYPFPHDRSVRMMLGCGIVLLALAGCATGSSVVDVWVPPVPAVASKQAVTIVEIRDLRRFAVNPGNPEAPSLPTQADIANPDKVARTIGRKGNAYGAQIGEVILPSGQTVSGVVRQTVVNALQDKGYVVVADASPGVLPVSIDIEQFWAWFTPGLFEAILQFESRVRLYGPEVFELDSTKIEVGSSLRTGGATEAAWGSVVRHGLETLAVRIGDEVEPATARTDLATVGSDSPAPAAANPYPMLPPSYSGPSVSPPQYLEPVPAAPAPSLAYPTPTPTPTPPSPAPAEPAAPAIAPQMTSPAPPPLESPALPPCDAYSYQMSLACDASATEVR